MSFIASLALAAIVVVPVFAAGPNQAPPANLVDAKFNSVTVGSASTVIGGIFNGTQTGIQVTGTAAAATFTGTNSGIVVISNGAGPAIQAEGNLSVTGAVNITGDTAIKNGTVLMNGLNIDNLGQISNASTDVKINDNLNVTGNVTATGATVNGSLTTTACPNCDAGTFKDNSTTNIVKFGTPTKAIDATGVVNMNSLNVDALGQISNTSGNVKINDNLDIIGQILSSTGAVTVNDADGFAITNGATKNMTIVPNGNLTTVSTAGNLDFNLANGTGTLYVEGGPGIGSILSVNKYGIYNPGFPPQPLNIIDHEGLAVADENGNVGLNFSSFGEGFISSPSGNVTVSSHLKANSIGSFYTTPYATNIVGTTISKTCPTGKLVSCFVNGLAAGNTIKSLTSSGEGCFLSTTATSINVAARCFDSAL